MDKNQREKLFEIAREIQGNLNNLLLLAHESIEVKSPDQDEIFMLHEKRLFAWALNPEVIPHLNKVERDEIFMLLSAYEAARYKKAKAFRILKESGKIHTKITNRKSYSYAFKQRLMKYEHLFNKEFLEDF